tara:strand:- start:408 stop:1217 length:810 start_codon:yes stop_codon:yes gene_type:complete
MIDPSAIIHPKARLGTNVSVGAYCLIEENVEVGDNCTLASHVILRSGTTLKANVSVDSFAVIGGNPQRRDFDTSLPSQVLVGEHTVLREAVTIHRAMEEGDTTRVGSHAFLMGGSHVGHDCQVGDYVTIANNVLLAGHVTVEDHCNLGGSAAFHQFIRVGEGAMVGGLAVVSQDIPRFSMVAERNRLVGLNLIGLKRRPFPKEVITDLKRCFHTVFNHEGPIRTLAKQALEEDCPSTEQGQQFLRFFVDYGKKGFASPRKKLKQANNNK